jgi:hypothetical protein
MIRYLYLAISSMALITLFQNCQPFDAQPLNELASLCNASSKEKLITSQLWKTSDCQELSHYKCAAKVYKPFHSKSEYEDIECFTFENESICLNIQYEVFDTSPLMMSDMISDEAFEDGGDFNRIEYRCTQSLHSSFEDILVEYGVDLKESFSKVNSSCLKGAQK